MEKNLNGNNFLNNYNFLNDTIEMIPIKDNSFFNEYKLYFDGCCKGNPGLGGCGFVIYKGKEKIFEGFKYLNNKITNNFSEYEGLICGLQKLIDLNIYNVDILGDSKLVIYQLSGIFDIKSQNLKPQYDKANLLLKNFKKYNLKHVLRKYNFEADNLANYAFNNKLTKL
jgi:ribonuclease HI